jgi:hypothetical protein
MYELFMPSVFSKEVKYSVSLPRSGSWGVAWRSHRAWFEALSRRLSAAVVAQSGSVYWTRAYACCWSSHVGSRSGCPKYREELRR